MKTSPEQVTEALRLSLKETQRLRWRNRRLRDAASEPLAIVGMACRYPGGVASPAELWGLLAEGRDAIAAFPSDRGWDLERLYDPDPDSPGTSYAREGGFLYDVADFDPAFFGISPRQALAFDPQLRLLLEAAWEALEDAGLDPHLLRGSQTGVFAGVMHHDYGSAAASSDVGDLMATGGTGSVVSGHVAYTLGLEGPAITVDTACSSSLVAMHLAAGALRGGECSLALAGGVTVMSTPTVFAQFSRQRGVAPDGRCKPFAEAADGTGFSEGAGMLVLERLSEARRNGHPVLATIRGSAVNQDGASNGLTAPNGPAQERVIRQALANAGLNASDIDAVEAHGTGTTLGDPIEAGALLATYGQDRQEPLALGSVKSNIGHTQAAAGVAGVIKMVLAMREGVLPPTLHLDSPSSKVDWDSGRIELLSEAREWAPGERPRRAGVSSFGASGTNAHLILEEAPESAEVEEPEASKDGEPGEGEPPFQGPLLFPLSAKSEPALRESAARLGAHLRERPELGLPDVAHSLATTRSSFEHRAVAVAGDREELLESLDSLAREGEGPRLARGLAHSDPRPVFLFPGQGSQWEGMALELLERSPVFAAHMQECEVALRPHVDWSLREVLAGAEDAPSIERIEVVQPLLFAVSVSLAELWRACGVRPAAVAGHSQGEIAAAHIAGGLSLGDAAQVAAVRSRIIAKLAGQGAMVSVLLSPEELEPRLEPWGGRIELAARNSPTSTILSADRESLEGFLARCAKEGIRAREVPATIPSHSTYVEPLREELLEALAPISPTTGEIPFHSTVTGGPLDTAELGAAYWYRNLRETVRFEGATRGLLEGGHEVFVEVSPHPVFALSVQETIEDTLGEEGGATVLGTLRRDEGGPERFALSLAHAHAHGADLDWEALTGPAERVPLPTYPFQRRRYWLSSTDAPAELSAAGLTAAEHPLLGARIEDPEGEGLILSGRISLSTHPWLADHAVTGAVILPGAAFLELALRAAEEVGAQSVEELVLQAPLPLPERGAVALQVRLAAPDGQGRREISIHSRPEEREGQWTCHARGVLSQEAPASPEPLGAWPPPAAEPIAITELYERLAQSGFEYGPAFQGLEAAWREGEEIYAEVSLAPEQATEAGRYLLHPALLDAAAHAGIEPMLSSTGAAEGQPGLPFAWREVGVLGPGAATLRIRWRFDAEGATATASDESGAPVLSVGSVLLRALEPAALAAARRLPLHRLAWKEIELPSAPAPAAALLGEETPELAAAERYRDPAALREAIAAGAGAPAIALAAPRERGAGEDVPRAAAAATRQALELAQRWAGAEGLQDSRLVLLTSNAVCAAQGEAPDLPTAPLWGLLRSAHSEHPERFALLDTDGSEASLAALPAALALAASEPQIALREGRALVPRLERIEPPDLAEAPPIDPDRTTLITGATSGIGALLARHLAAEHGARHLLLASRSGERAPGAEQLRSELEQLGCEARIAACDVSDREALAALLDSIGPEHPLGAVFHSAALLADGVLESLDAERLHQVMAPKADGAWHLHELSAGLELSAFVLFSSAAGLLGGAGQANYAAANAFLDALAAHRRSRGLPAVSLAWGGWDLQSGMLGDSQDRGEWARFAQQIRARLGLAPMPPEQGMQLLDAACAMGEPLLAPAQFDSAVLGERAASGALPVVLRGLVRSSRRVVADSLAARLSSVPKEERLDVLLDLVRSQVAAVLGYASGGDIEPERAFKELGFDSLGAVELRNRLVAATGLDLTPTVVFDYPSTAALARFLDAKVAGEAPISVTASAPVRSSDEPLAIVGMACRYPGGVASPAELWGLLAEGRDAIAAFPSDRGWDLERLYDPDPDSPGTSYAREGGFLYDVADFDPAFFGISPRQALAFDPQLRLLLEAAWEALEDAGLDPHLLRGSQTGVFAGVMHHDYGSAAASSDVGDLMATGGTGSVVSGHVAYTLGLEGPAITVDTACSSSLVAMHLAAGALRGGECSLALAGGVTVMSTPTVFAQFSRQRGVAPDGRCKPFAEAADGTGFSEGAGMLVLERLSEARRNGHPVLATIRGSAVNQDGASNGLTAPNGPAQERVIRQALANAGLNASDIDAVEAHGTGTTLGDPIEAGALLATYGQDRQEPLALGSVKSNIGHTQAAAGVAGVIKMVLAMREGVLPPTLHLDSPSSKVDWDSGRIELLSEAREWAPGERPRRAGVSSFGASGTNAHLILEEAPESAEVEEPEASKDGEPGEGEPPFQGPLLFPLSAKSEPALRESAARLGAHLRERPELGLPDVAHSLATTRSSFEHRAVAVAGDREELLESLDSLAREGEGPRLARGLAHSDPRPVFLFPGQGSQWEGMALELLERSPVFAAHMQECEVALRPHVDWSLREVLAGAEDAPSIERIEVVQPLLFAVSVSLAELWRACGVRPAAVAGHSQGEIAAAHIAGGLSLGDAAQVAAVRSRIIARLAGQGAMVSVLLSPEELEPRLEPWGGRIELAARNSPTSTILSADRESLEGFLARCAKEGIRAREVPATIPSHSTYVEPLREELLEALAPISPTTGEIPFHSTVTGGPLDTAELDASYWYRNLRETVRFEGATRGLLEGGHEVFVEVSPHPVFALSVQETIEDTLGEGEGATVLGTLRRDEGGPERFALSLAHAHAHGADLDWEALTGPAERVALPTYPFQRRRYWLSSTDAPAELSAAGLSAAEHPLLGARIEDPEGEGLILSGRISLSTHPWLADHAVTGAVILPGAAFLELALRAAEEVDAQSVEELVLQAPLPLPERGAVALQVRLAGPEAQGRREISIHSRPEEDEGQWTCHARGVLSQEAPASPEPLGAWPPPAAEPIAITELYERLAQSGFEYGPAFQGLEAAWREGEEIYAEVSLAPEQATEAGRYLLHPALLDAAAHAGIEPMLSSTGAAEGQPGLPFAWREVGVLGPGAATLRIRWRFDAEGATATASDESGAPVLSVGSVLLRALEPGVLAAARRLPLHRLAWKEIELPSAPAPAAALLGEEAPELAAAERYRDPAALREAIAAGAGAPAIALAAPRERGAGEDVPRAAAAATRQALELAQRWAGAEGLQDSRLVLLTSNAVCAAQGEAPDLPTAPLWGLLRSAHSEHPERFALLDTDGSEASLAALPAALALAASEPQIALREGRALVPRLERAAAPEPSSATPIDPHATVLITGATSGIGALLARHLAAEHGARHLLLVSRSGERAPGAEQLRSELEQLGCEARIAACDVSDREALAALLDSIGPEHPLGAVFHSAALLADGVLESLDAERLHQVMAPKADGAWHLHELSAGLELSAFVLFSSAAGLLGGAGQANYAAANAFLDALAAHRRSRGLPAVSLAWGGWDLQSASVDRHSGAVRASRFGLAAVAPELGLELFDAARGFEEPLLVPAAFDNAALRDLMSAGALSPVLRGLVRARAPLEREGESLAERLAGVPAAERPERVLALVQTHVAAVLGHTTAAAVPVESAFRDLGFDSLAAVELRNRLSAVTGMRLAPTLAFDYPSVALLAEHLLGEAMPGLESQASGEPGGDEAAEALAEDDAEDLALMSNEEVFELIDQELGAS